MDGLDLKEAYGLERPLGELLLQPTRIYVPECRALNAQFDVRSMVHITGGGFHENIPRGLPEGMGARLDRSQWTPPSVFGWLQTRGGLTNADMESTFNGGLGMIAVVPSAEAAAAAEAVGGAVVGVVTNTPGVEVL